MADESSPKKKGFFAKLFGKKEEPVEVDDEIQKLKKQFEQEISNGSGEKPRISVPLESTNKDEKSIKKIVSKYAKDKETEPPLPPPPVVNKPKPAKKPKKALIPKKKSTPKQPNLLPEIDETEDFFSEVEKEAEKAKEKKGAPLLKITPRKAVKKAAPQKPKGPSKQEKARSAALAKREKEFKGRELQLSKSEQQISTKENQFKGRDSSLKQRESAIKNREDNASKLKTSYDTKLNSLNSQQKKLDEQKKSFKVAEEYHKKWLKEQEKKSKAILEKQKQTFEKEKKRTQSDLKQRENLVQKKEKKHADWEKRLHSWDAELQANKKMLGDQENRLVEELDKRTELKSYVSKTEGIIRKEKEELEDSGFHVYLNAKLNNLEQKGDSLLESRKKVDIPHTELYELIDHCHELVQKKDVEKAKGVYAKLKKKFHKAELTPSEKAVVYNSIRELYDDIHLALIGTNSA